LGFYGVAPNVEILVGDFNLPIAQLCFVLITEPGEIGGRLSFTIKSPTGEIVIASGEGGMELVPQQAVKGLQLALSMLNISFKQPGRYSLNVAIDGKSHYQTNFEVRKGRPEDFSETAPNF
jgi:hypothetical protein